jgi:hypothetical protein
MYETVKNAEVRRIMADESLTHQDRIKKLSKMRDDCRAEQRMASESPAVEDDGLNARLRDVETMLERLGETPAVEEGKGPASL